MSPAKDYSAHINNWESISELQNANKEYISVKLPAIKKVLAPEFFESFKKNAKNISSIFISMAHLTKKH